MNNQGSVSSIQMSVLFLAFITGSSIVLIPGPLTNAARNGAWLSLFLALALGMVLLACVLYLHRVYPRMSFIEYSRAAVGKWLTLLLAIPYVTVMFWHVAGIVIEIGGFFNNTMLRETPTYAINTLFFATIAMTVRAGIEVIARMSVLLLMLMLGFTIVVLVMVAPLYHPEYLRPVLPDGIRPVLHGAYIAYGFPYSELTTFAMLLPFVRKQEQTKVGKFLFWALILNGVTLAASILCSIMVLGPLSGDLKYSLYQLARLIYVQEIVERIESVIGFSLIAGSYIKSTIMLFILSKVLAQLFKLQDERLLIFPVALICLLLSITMYSNEMSLDEAVNATWPLLDNAAYTLPLLLVMAVTLVKRLRKPPASA
ncbi:endospore germination permease [Paenibacillus hodogayensis]|uniref:Endospore germination permease n=1 Tax=Paenibacillus hodogayensis TaxID=279208 RepID=A0ABV5W382_9BACL